jgi:PKD repeat protein
MGMKRTSGGNMKRTTKSALIALTAVMLLGASLAATQFTAGAQRVGNPGPLNLKIVEGFIDINGDVTDLTPSELPACSDGKDNDDDGLTDFPDDPQCSAANDHSELAAGFQPKEDTVFSGTIGSDGTVNIPQSGIYFPPAYIESSGSVLTVRVQPLQAATGNLNPLTGAATLDVRIRIKLEGSPAGVSLGDSCFITPINLTVLTTGTTNPPLPNLPITGVPYNDENGLSTLVNNSFSVPGASGCGLFGIANGSINDALGLPSAAGNNAAVLTGLTNPGIAKGVKANVSVSALSGPAPLTVNFNGTGSTAVKGITSYQWDLGNGVTSTDPTTFTTYTAPGVYDAKLTVTDADGDKDTRIVPITVGEPLNIPPTAAIGTSGTEGIVPFTVSLSGSGSSDPDGSVVNYAWNFGNGQTATGENVQVTYNSVGTYTVTLTVTDNRGATGTATQQITVNRKPNVPPTAVARVVSTAGTIPLTVTLSGASSTDSDGSIVGYAWDFGNGQTATGVSVQTTYTTAGTYEAVLTVTDNEGATGSQSLLIEVSANPNIAPTAAFTPSVTSGSAPLQVGFDASDSEDIDGTIASYAWNFGNGQAASGVNPSVTYSVPGTYNVTLTVTDNRGAVGTATTQIIVSKPPNQSPTAALSANPSTGIAPLLVQLSSAGSSDPDGAIASYSWNFGNGQTGTGPSPSVVYNTPGTYVVTLTVTDNDGATNAKSTTVTVVAPNQLPTASIVATPTSGPAPLVVSVNGAGSSDPDGSIVAYAWDFGNGQTAAGPIAQTTYTSQGTFTIRLTVTDNSGATRTASRSINVGAPNAKPIATLTAIPTSGPAPLVVRVDATGSVDPDGSIIGYSWNFGNGQTATGIRSQVIYTTPGTYIITLTVTDNRGTTGTATETVVVDPPLPVTDRVRLAYTGAVTYNYEGPAAGTLKVTSDTFGLLSVSGSGVYVGKGGQAATVSANLSRFLVFNAFSGSVTVNDPGTGGVPNVTTNLFLQPLSRPSATSARGSVSGALPISGFPSYNLTFTIDDRA